MSAPDAPVAVGLPAVETAEVFQRIGRSDPRIAEAATALARRLGAGSVRLAPSGSLPVFEVGGSHVLKLYPPCFALEAAHERGVLDHLDGSLPVAVPCVQAAGELDGWQWLWMTRVPGAPLTAVWPRLDATGRLAIAAQAGRLLAVLHALRGVERFEPAAGWNGFLHAQQARCVEWQRSRGTDPAWLEQIPAFVEAAGLPVAAAPALLHTEVMREHLFAAETAGGWSLSGLIDFEPAMAGAPEYEFASVGLFLTCGDGPALRGLLRAYGYADSALGPALQRRFLAYALLHRYSSLKWYLERLPVPATVRTLDALAARWWALGAEPGWP